MFIKSGFYYNNRNMEHVSIKALKGKKEFIDNIRWDVTPKKLLEPQSPGRDSGGGGPPVNTDGYMMYVEVINNSPVLVIMKNRYAMSKTIAYVDDVPEDLLREAAHCSPEQCIVGMYPLTANLEEWLKETLGIS
jgi:hypothetical protein